MSSAFDVSGRAIIVTGGAGLLGREYGQALVDAGASVVLADLNEDGVTATARAIKGSGKAIGVGVDVTDEASVAALVRAALSAFGREPGAERRVRRPLRALSAGDLEPDDGRQPDGDVSVRP
jgi:NAD(P)-dependent dehydrogenase (short-subunit alcohol dehydrogenase family)